MENPNPINQIQPPPQVAQATVKPTSEGRKPWQKPLAKRISKNSILDLGPTPGTLENMTFSYKSI
ncbi:MAG: hypothetical protein FJX89_02255 [Bacteroidetes bacterium]|nr:hypothetical protein [Bacteroidota bacterium]